MARISFAFVLGFVVLLASYSDGQTVPDLKRSAELSMKNGDFVGALRDLDAAARTQEGWSDPGVFIRIASAAADANLPDKGIDALTRFYELLPEQKNNAKVRGIRIRLLRSDPATAATIDDVRSRLYEINQTKDPEEILRLCRTARNKLLPFLSNPWQGNVELWELGGVLAVKSKDRFLAAACSIALKSLPAADSDDFQGQHGLIRMLDECAGELVIASATRRTDYWKSFLRPYYAPPEMNDTRVPPSAFAEFSALSPSQKITFGYVLTDHCLLLVDRRVVMTIAESAFNDWMNRGSTTPRENDQFNHVDEPYVRLAYGMLLEKNGDAPDVPMLSKCISRIATLRARADKSEQAVKYEQLLEFGVRLEGSQYPDGPIGGGETLIDFNTAESFYLDAASSKLERAPLEAWFRLGLLYSPHRGHPTPKANNAKALDFLSRAEQVMTTDPKLKIIRADALYAAGVCAALGGDGVPVNRFRTVAYWRIARDDGSLEARQGLDRLPEVFKKWPEQKKN